MGMPVIQPGVITRDDAIGNIIESIAMQEMSLAHILNVESEKLQKIINLDGATSDQILKANKSVKETINTIIRLESQLQAKLSLFECSICTAASTIYDQQINDIIQSVALQETALANIQNAEGSKIQKFVSMNTVSAATLLCLNKSVQEMLEVIAMLEAVLKQKLKIVLCGSEDQCDLCQMNGQ